VMFGHSILIIRTNGENVFDYFKEEVGFGLRETKIKNIEDKLDVSGEGGVIKIEKDMFKRDTRFVSLGQRGPLINQDLCKVTCVNLHIFPHQNTKMYICVNTICYLCF